MGKIIKWEEFVPLFCEHMGMNPEEISSNTDIYNDIGIDSLGIMTLGMKLQKAFKVEVPLSEVSSINTLGEMLALLNRYTGE